MATSISGKAGAHHGLIHTLTGMQILAQIKVNNESATKLSKFLAEIESGYREIISAKILSQKWTRNKFYPSGKNADVQNMIFDLLVTYFKKQYEGLFVKTAIDPIFFVSDYFQVKNHFTYLLILPL